MCPAPEAEADRAVCQAGLAAVCRHRPEGVTPPPGGVTPPPGGVTIPGGPAGGTRMMSGGSTEASSITGAAGPISTGTSEAAGGASTSARFFRNNHQPVGLRFLCVFCLGELALGPCAWRALIHQVDQAFRPGHGGTGEIRARETRQRKGHSECGRQRHARSGHDRPPAPPLHSFAVRARAPHGPRDAPGV